MTTQPDLHGLTKGQEILCGSSINLAPTVKSALAKLCIDCGKNFGSPKDKAHHVAIEHPTSNNDNNAKPCSICWYKKKNHMVHHLIVGAPLQLPTGYPAVKTNQPDLRSLKKGEPILCGSSINLTPTVKSALAVMCIDCGKNFNSPKDKERHVVNKHPASHDNNAKPCQICWYKKKNHKVHRLIVGAPLQLPIDYPAVEAHVSDSEEEASPPSMEMMMDANEDEGGPEIEGGDA